MIRKSDKYCLQYENEKALKTNKDPGLKNNIDYHAARYHYWFYWYCDETTES